jgi:hypothetical protein
MPTIKENLETVKGRVARAALDAGRKPEEVKLLAVSKTFPAADVLEAFQAGQLAFGENRVQELETKVPELPKEIQWHLIGHLQSNKAAKAIALASWIHSVDTAKLLEKLERLAEEAGAEPSILLELNVSGEESKAGTRDADEAMRLAETAMKCRALRLKGLMTMAPLDADEALRRRVFASLRQMRERMERELGATLPELSMGMSQDFVEAVKEGSTMVRVGTAIFGAR